MYGLRNTCFFQFKDFDQMFKPLPYGRVAREMQSFPLQTLLPAGLAGEVSVLTDERVPHAVPIEPRYLWSGQSPDTPSAIGQRILPCDQKNNAMTYPVFMFLRLLVLVCEGKLPANHTAS